jgi:hypothetical protein
VHVDSHLAAHRHPKTSTRVARLRESSSVRPAISRHRPRVDRSSCRRLCDASPTSPRTTMPSGGLRDHSNISPLPFSRTVSPSEEKRAVDSAAFPHAETCGRSLPAPAGAWDLSGLVSACRHARGSEPPNRGRAGLAIGSPRYVGAAREHCVHRASLRAAPPLPRPPPEPKPGPRTALPRPRTLGMGRAPDASGSRSLTPHAEASAVEGRAGWPSQLRAAAVCSTPKDAAPSTARCGLRASGHRPSLGGRQRRPCRSSHPADLRTEVQTPRGGSSARGP